MSKFSFITYIHAHIQEHAGIFKLYQLYAIGEHILNTYSSSCCTTTYNIESIFACLLSLLLVLLTPNREKKHTAKELMVWCGMHVCVWRKKQSKPERKNERMASKTERY